MFNVTIKLKDYDDPAVFDNCTTQMVKDIMKGVDPHRVSDIQIKEIEED